uniref:Uncharacterized protein n=1 Tax=Pithovirus LCPAC101 TaxID=2506586 RepID=A0A481Z3L1_9VIRU|nr:MAG: hypothetical protein LCPAC101_03290 [Pithovirus LCPAC101]
MEGISILEKQSISAYKTAEKSIKGKRLSNYWFPDYSYNYKYNIKKYLKNIKLYIIKLSKANKLRQVHYNTFIKDIKDEEIGHKRWRLAMKEVLDDTRDKYKYWLQFEDERDDFSLIDFRLENPEYDENNKNSSDDENNGDAENNSDDENNGDDEINIILDNPKKQIIIEKIRKKQEEYFNIDVILEIGKIKNKIFNIFINNVTLSKISLAGIGFTEFLDENVNLIKSFKQTNNKQYLYIEFLLCTLYKKGEYKYITDIFPYVYSHNNMTNIVEFNSFCLYSFVYFLSLFITKINKIKYMSIQYKINVDIQILSKLLFIDEIITNMKGRILYKYLIISLGNRDYINIPCMTKIYEMYDKIMDYMDKIQEELCRMYNHFSISRERYYMDNSGLDTLCTYLESVIIGIF